MCFLNSVGRATNEYKLVALESDKLAGKDEGLWHETVLIETEGTHDTFMKVKSPDKFKIVNRIGGWAAEKDAEGDANMDGADQQANNTAAPKRPRRGTTPKNGSG